MSLKHERDRFVAFAFAAADAFIEVDEAGSITFAGGALNWLAGNHVGQLPGKKLVSYFSGRNRSVFEAAVRNIKGRGRLGPLTLNFRGYEGKEKPIAVYGTYLPDYPKSVFLSLKAVSRAGLSSVAQEKQTDRSTGLIKPENFKNMASTLAKSTREDDEDIGLTMFEVGGLNKTLGQLDDEAGKALMEDIAAQLCAVSLEGSSVAKLSEQGYGIIHDADMDIDSVQQGIKAVDNGGALDIHAATIPLDDAGLSDSDHIKALAYTINKFWSHPEGFNIGNLADGYEMMLAENRSNLAKFRKVLSKRQFEMVLQPIVDLDSRTIHHYEALARIEAKDVDTLPQNFISIAEDMGVICDFDIAMCTKVINRIKKANGHGKKLNLAVNVSGRSLMTDGFVSDLLKMLKDCDDIRDQLMFEVTESTKIEDLDSTNRILSQIRKLGHHVCLDDFGAGAAGYQYLRALDVDFVKIDGIYIREAFSTTNGRAFLKSMAGLCGELGISTVGEFVETAGQAKFLKDIGVNYGQGYFFGKPSPGVVNNTKPYSF